MAAVVESDSSGRIVIPKKLRDSLGIKGKTQFLLTTTEKGQILIQKLDIDEIAARLDEELRDIPVEEYAKQIRDEVNEKVRQAYPDTA